MDTRSRFNAAKYEQDGDWKLAFRPDIDHYQRIGLDPERQYSTQEIDEAYQVRVNWWKERKRTRDKGHDSNTLIKQVGPYIDDALAHLAQVPACLLDAEKKRAYDRSLEQSRNREKETKLLGFIAFTLRDNLLTSTEKRDLLEQARELGIARQRAEQLIWQEMAKCGGREVSDEEVISQAATQADARPVTKVDPPHLVVSQTSFPLGTLRKGQQRECVFATDNKGGGILKGNIEVSDPEWLKVSDTEITGRKHHQEIRVSVDTSSLALGSTYAGTIYIHSNGGRSEVRIDFTVELEKDAVSRFGQALFWIGFVLGGLFGYVLYSSFPGTATSNAIAFVAGAVATVAAVVVGAKLGKWGGGIGAFFLAGITADILKATSMATYSTGAWATIGAAVLYVCARPLLVGKHAKKPGALIGVSAGGTVLALVIVLAGVFAASLAPPPSLQTGTVTTCASVRGWHNFTAKTEFKLNEPVCVYAEALNVSSNNRVDVNYAFTLLGPDRNAYASRAVRCLLANTTATACEENVPDLRLPPSAPSGSYILQVEMRNNLTGQTGQGASTFSVIPTANLNTQREPSGLLEAMKSQRPFIGETGENTQRWPATLTFVNVDMTSGHFTGQIDWTSLNAVTRVEGVAAGNALSFTETEFIRPGNVQLGVSYKLALIQGNKLEGGWSYQNRSGPASFTIPVSTLPDAAPQQAHSAVDPSAGVVGNSQAPELAKSVLAIRTIPGDSEVFLDGKDYGESDADGGFVARDVPPGAHQLTVRKTGYREFQSAVQVTVGQETSVDAQLQSSQPAVSQPQIPLTLLNIEATPESVVFVDGLQRGLTDGKGSLIIHGLSPGTHQVSIRRPGYSDGDVSVLLSAGDFKTVSAPLLNWVGGFLTVKVSPPDAAVDVVGIGHFQGGVTDFPCLPGNYKVIATHTGLAAENESVTIGAGQHAAISISLSPHSHGSEVSRQ